MVVSKEYKWTFYHIPKNAGISLRKALEPYGRRRGDTYMHVGIRDCEPADGHFTFAFVRNPWERMYSAYTFWNRRRKEIPEIVGKFKSYDSLDMPFKEWLVEGKFWEDDYKMGEIPPFQRRSQSYYLTYDDVNLAVDYVGTVENLEDSLRAVTDRLGMEPCEIPRLNLNPVEDTYRQAYDEESVAFVAQHHSWEIAKFGYKF